MESLTQALASNPSFTPLFRLLDDFERYSRRLGVEAGHHRHHHRDHAFSPRFDLRELPAAFELYGELPGVRKEDITIEFNGQHTLVVRGSVHHSYEEPITEDGQGRHGNTPMTTTAAPEADANGARWWVSERGEGAFSRSFDLPVDVDQAAVTANLDAGVLRVRVPKVRKDAERTRRIEIV